MANELRQYWRVAGIDTTKDREGQLVVERPDFWGVKITLLGLDGEDAAALMDWLASSDRSAGVQKHAKSSIRYVRDRYKAEGTASQAKKHVLIAGGRANSKAVREGLAEAEGWAVARMKGRLLASGC